MYNTGTVTTTANSTKLIGVGTKWKDNNSRVSAEQVILIQNGATIYINSIASIQSNTEITLSFPVPASVSNAPYQILTTMVNSVSDAANKIVAMNVANVQFSDILNRWATESGTITVTLPDGTTQQLRTAKEMDKLLDGKFDKAGGDINGRVTVNSSTIRIIGTDDWPGLSIRKKNGEEVRIEASNTTETLLDISYRDTENKQLNTFIIPRKSGTAMLVGDYGVGVSLPQSIENNTATTLGCGFYAIPGNAGNPWGNDGSAHIINVRDGKYGFQIGRTTGNKSLSFRTLDNGEFSPTSVLYSTLNTTKDSNGNLKAASPIVKVFADHIETNEESEGVEMEHLGVGHYLIKGVVGFNADGAWGINNGFVIPQDHNGKNMVLIDYKVRPDGDIEVFVFHQQNADLPERFQNKRIKYIDKDDNPVYYENYEPCDVPESRWIDMRVEMPVNSIYNLKQAEAERLAKEEAERQAKEEAKKAELEAE